MSDVANSTADAIKAQIVARAAEEPAFRAQLLANPRAAIEAWTGDPVAPGLTLKAIEEGPDEYVVVLPHQLKTGAGGELSDADLEAVAGGASKAESDNTFKKLASTAIAAPSIGGMVLDSLVKTGDTKATAGKFEGFAKQMCNYK